MHGTGVTGVVLAGGRSRRMGRDKARIPVAGRPLLTRALDALAPVCDERLVIGPPEREQEVPPGVRVVQDRIPDVGPLGGIYTALSEAGRPLALVVACDMPFLNPALLGHLISLADGYDVVLPRTAEGGHQTHAVYAHTCLTAVEAQLQRGQYRIDRFFDAVRVRYVDNDELRAYDPDLLSLFNVNTPEDLERAEAILRGARSGG